jgi:hypothetical protein
VLELLEFADRTALEAVYGLGDQIEARIELENLGPGLGKTLLRAWTTM